MKLIMDEYTVEGDVSEIRSFIGTMSRNKETQKTRKTRHYTQRRSRKENLHKRWTEAENARLLALRKKNNSWKDVSLEMGRTKDACRMQYHKLTRGV